MVKLPDTRPEMLAADFEGVAEALKGKHTHFCVTKMCMFFHSTEMFQF